MVDCNLCGDLLDKDLDGEMSCRRCGEIKGFACKECGFPEGFNPDCRVCKQFGDIKSVGE